jgi:uncharacterized RDD family membrane protein YckC
MDGIEAERRGETEGDAAVVWDREPHPWRRYAARSIDLGLFGFVGTMAVAILLIILDERLLPWLSGGLPLVSFFVLSPLAWLTSVPPVAFCHARWGATPGKLLCGLRVLDGGGGRPGFSKAVAREGRLLLWGAGFGLPLIGLGCAMRSYTELEGEGEARWDRDSGCVSLARPAVGWQRAGLVAAAAIVVLLKAWGAAESWSALGR